MARILVQVQDFPQNEDIGRIELTYRSTRPVMVDVQTTRGWEKRQGVEPYSETETLTYCDAEARAMLLEKYKHLTG
jgi:hypothetical protein